MISRQRILVIGVVFGWTLVARGQSSLVLVRNNSITSLDPTTPPIATLVDQGTGALQGIQTAQNTKYAFYAEAFAVGGDGPLVLYQLNNPNQTLFLAKTGGQITLSSFVGSCEIVDAHGLALAISTLPALKVEHDHALQLYGIDIYPSATVCRDSLGIVGVTTAPVALTDRSVELLFLRDPLDVPAATISVTHGNVLDLFDLNGGMRHDLTDAAHPVYVPLDANGSPVGVAAVAQAASTTCAQAANNYHNCLKSDQTWLNYTNTLTGGTLDTICAFPALLEGCLGSLAVLGATDLFFEFASTLCQAQVTGTETCSGASPQCSSGSVCHVDSRNWSAYCTYPTTGPNSCTPTQVCGGPPYCTNGLCWTDPLPAGTSCAEDNNPCTDDVCDGTPTCTHPNNTAVCRPAIGPCDIADRCTNGSCPIDRIQPNGTVCDDANACTIGDSCAGGNCQSGTGTLNCDDHNACTDDSCNSAMGCVNTPIAGCTTPLETITVPSDGSAVLSSTTLASGITYVIRASGIVSIGGGCLTADAEYFCFLDYGRCSPFDDPWDLGIGINSPSNTPNKATRWGAYNPTHVYSVNFVGLGAPISLRYHDCAPADNVGSFTVDIGRPN